MTTQASKPLSALTAALAIASVAVLSPLWAPLVLAAWAADLLRPAVRKLERLLRGRRRAAGALVVLVVVAVLLPLAGVTMALVSAVRELLGQLRAALEGQGSLAGALLGGTDAVHPAMPNWADLANRYGASAWRASSAVARASASALIGVLVFIAALYTLAVDGERAYAWLETHVPIPKTALARLASAFRETGRGLIVSGGGTALVQGAIATVAFVAIGIPRALILGPITAVCALVPVVGTGLVWVPLAIELGLSGRYGRAVAVAVVGVGIGLVDNFIRPMLTRYGHLKLPALVVLVAMLGGVVLLGPTGALLGPLVVRVCVEALAMAAEARLDAPTTSPSARSMSRFDAHNHRRDRSRLAGQAPPSRALRRVLRSSAAVHGLLRK